MRIKLAYTALISVLILLIVRVYYLSVASNDYYENIAQNNAIKTESIPPVRGQIFDIKGRPLAVNMLGFSIFLKPHLKSNSKELNENIDILCDFFPDLNATKIKKKYIRKNSPYNQENIELVDFVNYDEMIKKYSKLKLQSNLIILPTSKRFYPFNELASHVIGYVGRSNQKDFERNPISKITNRVGRSGMEKYYNDILQGKIGEKKTKVTAFNRVVEEISFIKPSSQSITLSIDLEMQKFLNKLFEGLAGAAIVMNLNDGSILAAGSFPEYDLNPFVTGISKKRWAEIIEDFNHPFTNKLVNSLYPPGSVAKMAVGMSFFDSGKISPKTKIMCDPYFELGNRKFRNWRSWGREKINIVKAIKESCDTYFYRGAYQVGIDDMYPAIKKFGFGRKTGVDLPNEYIGIVPNKEWKFDRYGEQWYQGDTLNTSIGQGSFLVTPMQVAKDTAFFANGLDVTPHFLYSVDKVPMIWKNKDILTKSEKENIKFIKEGMYEVANVLGGTAFRALRPSKIVLGAKTGTAQVVGIPQSEKVRMNEKDMDYFSRSHAWITTFGPYEKPQFVVTVLVEHGSHGGGTGGPIVADIYNKLVELGYISKKYLKPKYR